VQDERLAQAAAELLLRRAERPSPSELGSVVRAVGSDAVGLHALYLPLPAESSAVATWLGGLRERLDGQLTCGRADGEQGQLWIAYGRGAELQAVDEVARVVRGRLEAGFRDAELVVATGDGQLLRMGVSADRLEQGIELAQELTPPLKVQLVARGPSGPRPVAEREVATDRTQPRPAAEPHAPAARAETSSQDLASLVLQLRTERGRSALRDNRLLREAADKHARAVCASGRVAHELDAGDGPQLRLARAGLSARVLGEAIARADGSRDAMLALQNSPSHLYTLLDQRFTDFGVGVARDQAQKYCYVVLLCAWPRFVGKRGQ
jgi:uncharacterized protein YkwD